MRAPEKYLIARLAWDDVAARIEAGAAAVLPIGAGAKEHGLHLPMDTDRIQAEWLAGIVAREIDALVWPTLTFGFYPAFVHYAGSVSLSRQTFVAVVREIVDGLCAFGVRAVLVIDTGISTLEPVAEAIAASGQREKIHHLRVHDGPRYSEAAARLAEQEAGSHADELETSRMLALAPALVRMDRAKASPPGKGGARIPLSPTDPTSPNYSVSGSWGDPTLATSEKGEVLLAAMAADVADMARQAIKSSPG